MDRVMFCNVQRRIVYLAVTVGFLILLGAAAEQASNAEKARSSGPVSDASAAVCLDCTRSADASNGAAAPSGVADSYIDSAGRLGFYPDGDVMLQTPRGENAGSHGVLSALVGRDLRFYTEGQSRMVIDELGSVGIGTSRPSPLYRLSVNGGIRAKEIVVETGWADFVFEDGYDLWSLHDIQAYIERNGHLPEIPSAAEVAAQGVSLGEMDARLLRKIEEMTLHLISFDNRLGELEADTQVSGETIDADCAAPATAEER